MNTRKISTVAKSDAMSQGECVALISEILLPDLAKITAGYLEGTPVFVRRWDNRDPSWGKRYSKCRNATEQQWALWAGSHGIYRPHRIWPSSNGILVCDALVFGSPLAMEDNHRIRLFSRDGTLLENCHHRWPGDQYARYVANCFRGIFDFTAPVVLHNHKKNSIRVISRELVLPMEEDEDCYPEGKVAFLPNGRVAVCTEDSVCIYNSEGEEIGRTGRLHEMGKRCNPTAIAAVGDELFVGAGGFYIHVFHVW